MRVVVIVSLIITVLSLTSCASQQAKTVDDVYKQYGSKAVYENPYTADQIQSQEIERQRKENENIKRAFKKEQEQNRILRESLKQQETKPIKVAPKVIPKEGTETPEVVSVEQPQVSQAPESTPTQAPVKANSPASLDLNFSQPIMDK
ncbi:MAG: hypothetical protein KF802_02710 [Bdellovibrionaceae bacterium]|nr:hypothetical protein [Pseudobdellovibrionaceae bacterium]